MHGRPKIHLHNASKYLNSAVYTNSLFLQMCPVSEGKDKTLVSKCVSITIHQRQETQLEQWWELWSQPFETLQSKSNLAFSCGQNDKFATEWTVLGFDRHGMCKPQFCFFYSTVNCHPKHSFHSVYVDIVLLNGWEQSTCLVSVPTFQVALIKENIRKTYRPIIILCGLEKSDSDPVNNNYWPEKSVQFQNI